MNRQTILVAVIMTVLGGTIGYFMHGGPEPGMQMQTQEQQPLFYRNPMNPAITSPVPAKDEMGMDYIPVYADAPGGAEPTGTVIIDPVSVQNIGVRTAKVARRTISRTVRAVGRIAFDEERLTRLHPKIEGWIEELYVESTGARVERGTILLGIYSPQLVTSQEEYLLAVKNAEALQNSPFPHIRKGAENLLTSTRQRLELMDVPAHQIAELAATGQVKKSLHIHSPFDGVVMRMGARKGQFVTPKTELYTIADLSRVWVYVDVFDSDLPWVTEGDEARMRLSGLPGRDFVGRIRYVYPYAEAATRTVKVRLEFDNPDRMLKPDMFADVTIHASRQVDALVIPTEAIVRSGPREQVFLVRGPGKFMPRLITPGVTSDGWTQVLKGLEEGDVVVTSAQFLIDSESKLREATAKMMESMQVEAPVMESDMGDMDDMTAPEPAPKPATKSAPMTGHEGHDMGAAQ